MGQTEVTKHCDQAACARPSLLSQGTAATTKFAWCLLNTVFKIQWIIYNLSVKQREVGQPPGARQALEYRYLKERQEFYKNEILVSFSVHHTSQHLHYLPIRYTHVQFYDRSSVTIKIRGTMCYLDNN